MPRLAKFGPAEAQAVRNVIYATSNLMQIHFDVYFEIVESIIYLLANIVSRSMGRRSVNRSGKKANFLTLFSRGKNKRIGQNIRIGYSGQLCFVPHGFHHTGMTAEKEAHPLQRRKESLRICLSASGMKAIQRNIA
jgi:hypothetical protein